MLKLSGIIKLPRRLPKFHMPGRILLLALLALLVYLLGWSTLFSARSVVIVGTQRSDEIRALLLSPSSKFHIGEPLARVDVHSLNRKISAIDWVEKESVRRNWLHGSIEINISERIPVGQFEDSAGTKKLIDKTGTIFTNPGGNSYPVITFSHDDADLIKSGATFISELPADLLSNLQSIDVFSAQHIQSMHRELGAGQLLINWGSNEEVSVKVRVLRSILALPENVKATFVDLSSPLAPIAR